MGRLFKAKRSLYIHPDVCAVVEVSRQTSAWSSVFLATPTCLPVPRLTAWTKQSEIFLRHRRPPTRRRWCPG